MQFCYHVSEDGCFPLLPMITQKDDFLKEHLPTVSGPSMKLFWRPPPPTTSSQAFRTDVRNINYLVIVIMLKITKKS